MSAGLTGGSKLATRLKEIARKVADADVVKVGFLEGATYPDGTSVALVAAMNEFGAGASPPRPFFRPMVAAKAPQWGAQLAAVVKANDYSVPAALGAMGEVIKGELQVSIKAVAGPPLAPATVARKGFAKPLIDTGNMWNSVDYEVGE